MSPIVEKVLADYGLLTAFALVGLTMAIAYWASDKLTRGRLHGSAIAQKIFDRGPVSLLQIHG